MKMLLCIAIFIITLIGFALAGRLKLSLTSVAFVGMSLMLLTGCLEPSVAIQGFSNVNVILMGSMFIVANGLNKTQLLKNISAGLCSVSKGSFTKILAGYVLLTFILCQFIPSGVVVYSIVCPMAIGICRELDEHPSKMMFSLGFIAIVSCCTLPLGSGITEQARIQGFLEVYDYVEYPFRVIDLTIGKLPVMIVMVLIAIFFIPKTTPNIDYGKGITVTNVLDTQERLSPFREVVAYATFFLVLAGMIFSSEIGLENWEISLFGAVIITLTGVLNKKEALEGMNLSMILLYIASLGIGMALSSTGAADLIGDTLSVAIVRLHSNFLAGLLFVTVPLVLVQFMMNGGIYTMLAPVYIMICKSMAVNPTGPLLLCLIGCQTALFTPMASPTVPVMMASADYGIKDIVKMGMIPTIVIAFVSAGWVMAMYPIF